MLRLRPEAMTDSPIQAQFHPVSSSGSCPGDHALFILGRTRIGQPFRPSDWVDRLAGLYASFGRDKRLRYSPWVRPAVLDGQRGVWLDAGLHHRDPAAYAFVMAFVHSHDLTILPAGHPA